MDGMISQVENPKYFIEKLLELINSAKQQDTKSTQKKSVVLPYTNNEQSTKEIKKTIPFTYNIKKNKVLRN